jgi:hypothetical protein
MAPFVHIYYYSPPHHTYCYLLRIIVDCKMNDHRVPSTSQPASQQPDVPEPGNVYRLKRPFDPATMYFEVDDVIFEGESREAHVAEEVYQQALEEEKKVTALAHKIIIRGNAAKLPTGIRLTEIEQPGRDRKVAKARIGVI